MQTLRAAGVPWEAASEELERERNGTRGLTSGADSPILGSLPVDKNVGFREGVAPLDLLQRLGTEPKEGLGKEQATSRGAPGGLESLNAAPNRGQGLSNQRVKTPRPAPARGLAASGGVARGRARVCRSCRWAGPGGEREGRGAELAPRRAPRRAGFGLRQRAGPVASVPKTPRRTLEQRVSEAGPARRPSQLQPTPVPSAPRDSSGGTRSWGGGASRRWGPGGRGVEMRPMMSWMLRRAWGAVEAGGGAARIMSPLPLRPAPRGHTRRW